METPGLAEKADVSNFFTPMQSLSSCSGQSDAEAASSVFYSTRSEWLSELRRKCGNELEFDVEASKSHWTELSGDSDDSDVQVSNSAATGDSDASDGQVSNSVLFEKLKEHPLWGPLFRRQIHGLEIGAKIAEGGQAEIYEALGRKFRNPSDVGCSEDARTRLVLKVFKKGYSLVDLQRSWPPALVSSTLSALNYGDDSIDDFMRSSCWAVGVHLMEDGRFAFVFHRYWGDLRKLIDENMWERNGCPPFDGWTTYRHIRDIAGGMRTLHSEGILHNDLKAANVLVLHRTAKDLVVADFESSVGILGTGFWRAPEILLALKNGTFKPETSTRKCDVYSFAMTCYEVIIGHMPFEDHEPNDYDIVLRGERPTLPNDLPYSMYNDLVTSCWHQDPLKRPSFKEIWKDLHAIKQTYSLRAE